MLESSILDHFFWSESKKSHSNSRLPLFICSCNILKDIMFEEWKRSKSNRTSCRTSVILGQIPFGYVTNFNMRIKVLELRV